MIRDDGDFRLCTEGPENHLHWTDQSRQWDSSMIRTRANTPPSYYKESISIYHKFQRKPIIPPNAPSFIILTTSHPPPVSRNIPPSISPTDLHPANPMEDLNPSCNIPNVSSTHFSPSYYVIRPASAREDRWGADRNIPSTLLTSVSISFRFSRAYN